MDIIPFNRSSVLGKELEYILGTVTAGQIAGGQGFSRKCESLLEGVLGVPKALITTSCTHALEMCALLIDIQPGDEVIVPSFTFVSTPNAFALRGAQIVFVDIRPDTLNLDEKQLEAAITQKTKAIVPVHYAGVGCEMDEIMSLASLHGLSVIEDNAHGLFGKYKDRSLGTIGCLASQSFHETKNITCGEGGALLLNDPTYIERAEIIREKGTDRSRYFRGQVDKYTWVDIGSSYVMSDVLAAFLFGQLEVWPQIQERRSRIWQFYNQQLANWAERYEIGLPFIPNYCQQAYHMYYLLMPSLESRQKLIEYLKGKGILAVFHYLPLHLSKIGREFGGKPGACPVCENISERLLRLPFYNSLSDTDQARVVETVTQLQL